MLTLYIGVCIYINKWNSMVLKDNLLGAGKKFNY